MDEQLEFLRQIAARLDGAGIPYMLTGSLAQAIHAVPRMTRDIDLVVEVAAGDAAPLVALFEGDCYIDREAVDAAIADRGMFNIIQTEWVIKADFIVRKHAPFRELEFRRRRQVDIGGASVWVVSAEDLVLSKLCWAKQADSELQRRDAGQILRNAEELDRRYLRRWAGELGVLELLERVEPR